MAHIGHETIVKWLAENGADINAVNATNHSALHSATESGKFYGARLLKILGGEGVCLPF